MDLVNSVTQNSNNKKIEMENLPPDVTSYGGSDYADDENGSADNSNQSAKKSIQMQASPGESSGSRTELQLGPQSADDNKTSQVPNYLKAIGMDPKKFWPRKYRFTREKSPGQHNPLSIAQRNFYENNGYIVIDECSSQKLIDAIRDEYKRSSLVSEFLVDKLVAKNGKLLQYVKCFCDDRLMLMTHKVVETFQSVEQAKAIMDNKQPQRQRLYRDWIYLPFRPIDKVVCALTALDPLNHIILVVPGTHRVGQTMSSTLESITAAYETSQERHPARNLSARELYECSPDNLSSLVEKSRKGFKYVNLKAGQTLFYHPGLVHGFSDDLINFRKSQLALVAYYAAADCEYVEMRRQLGEGRDEDDNSLAGRLPISLDHFKEQDPSDYNSWINRPRLISEPRAGL